MYKELFSTFVPSEGSTNAELCFVGEAPGETETILKKPFVGSSGQVLNQLLHACGIVRNSCYITNLIKLRPAIVYGFNKDVLKSPKDDNDFRLGIFWKGYSPTSILQEARLALLDELSKLPNLKVIVPLGANALWALTGHKQIGKWRGSAFNISLPNGKQVTVVGTYHPAAVIKEWELYWVSKYDLIKAKGYLNKPYKAPERNLTIAPTCETVWKFIESCSSAKHLSYDIETRPGEITCISLAKSPHEAISIPLTKEYWGQTSIIRDILIKLNRELLQRNDIVKVAQNITFDNQYLFRFFSILPAKPWFDTMIAFHSLFSELPKSLAFLTSIYTEEPYYKDDLKIWQSGKTSDEMLWTYNAKDSAVTLEIMYELDKELDEHGVRSTYDYMIKLLDPLLFMMLSGLNIDSAKTEEHKKFYQNTLDEKELSFSNNFGTINPRSPKQLKELANKFGFDVDNMNEKTVNTLAKTNPTFADILDIRNSKKMISTYIKAPVDPISGKMLFSLNSTGTTTGRLSSSASVFGSGTNLQNVPKIIRDIIAPDKGMMFTEADLKGAEAMVVAYLCNDPILIKMFNDGANIHTWTAQMIWGVSADEVKADHDKCANKDTWSMYDKAKRIRHGGNYLASWRALQMVLDCSAQEAKKLLKRFYDFNPNLTYWHRQVSQQLRQNRTIISLLGRKRLFLGRFGDEMLRQAVAYNPQETVCHVVNLGIINIYDALCKDFKGVSVKLQVHDSVLIEHPPDMKHIIHSMLPGLMKVILTCHGKEFFIPIEIKSGFNWRDLK